MRLPPRPRLLAPLLILLVGAGSLTLRAAGPPVSEYTSTAKKNALSWKETNDEAGGSGLRARFRGFGDYELLLLTGDARSWLNVRWRGREIDLYAPTMELAPGGFPNTANDVVEWRGVRGRGGKLEPYALIFRLSGVDENGRNPRTRLIVVRLDGERTAVLGYAQGKTEDADAKRLADTARK